VKRNRVCCSALAVGVLLGASSCATTTLNTVWKDDAFTARLSKVLVTGCAKNETTRRAFEDEFVRQLTAAGVEATASYTLFPSAEELKDKDAVNKRIKPMGFDAVLVSRVVDRKTQELYYPPETEYHASGDYFARPYRAFDGWNSYYADSYENVTQPGYTVEEVTLKIDTSVYALADDRMVYSAISSTEVTEVTDQDIKEFVAVLVKSLKTKGLI